MSSAKRDAVLALRHESAQAPGFQQSSRIGRLLRDLAERTHCASRSGRVREIDLVIAPSPRATSSRLSLAASSAQPRHSHAHRRQGILFSPPRRPRARRLAANSSTAGHGVEAFLPRLAGAPPTWAVSKDDTQKNSEPGLSMELRHRQLNRSAGCCQAACRLRDSEGRHSLIRLISGATARACHDRVDLVPCCGAIEAVFSDHSRARTTRAGPRLSI